MKKTAAIYLAAVLFFTGTCTVEVNAADSVSEKGPVWVFLKPEAQVDFRGEKKVFKDGNGQIAFPIIYQGKIYLPLRGLSGMFGEPIEWNEPSKTLFFGKTMSAPDKGQGLVYEDSAEPLEVRSMPEDLPEMDEAYVREDAIVMVDFVIKPLQGEEGDTFAPIIYRDSTYLPVRMLCEMLGEPVYWNEGDQTIYMGNLSDKSSKDKGEIGYPSNILSELKDLFSRSEALYYEATAKSMSIREAKNVQEREKIAKALSKDYQAVRDLSKRVPKWNSFGSLQEVDAYREVKGFIENTEQYLLILENIAYLAATDESYAMLSDFFFEAALSTQTTMDAARTLLQ